MDASKAGWKTTEFWLSLAAVLVAYLVASDLGDETTWIGKGLAIVAAVLAALGYTASRAVVKRERIRKE